MDCVCLTFHVGIFFYILFRAVPGKFVNASLQKIYKPF